MANELKLLLGQTTNYFLFIIHEKCMTLAVWLFLAVYLLQFSRHSPFFFQVYHWDPCWLTQLRVLAKWWRSLTRQRSPASTNTMASVHRSVFVHMMAKWQSATVCFPCIWHQTYACWILHAYTFWLCSFEYEVLLFCDSHCLFTWQCVYVCLCLFF